jgi:two-component system sensor kinase FixL
LADRIQIQQVLVNLLHNAFEALDEVPEEQRDVTVRTSTAQDMSTVTVTITDRATGLTPDQFKRVFEPYYTTKPAGMGMGLSISRTIITNHEGRLWAESNPEGGTTFLFTLPTEAETAEM